MNKERLLLVKQTILNHPEHFNYNRVLSPLTAPARNLIADEPTCNTVGCIIGYTLAVFMGEEWYTTIEYRVSSRYSSLLLALPEIARIVLELTDEESESLLYGVAGVGLAHVPDMIAVSAQQAADRIDAFIAYKESKIYP